MRERKRSRGHLGTQGTPRESMPEWVFAQECENPDLQGQGERP